MTYTREQAYGALASLQPATVFLDSYRVRRLPEQLDTYFGPPEEFFIAPATQEIFTRGRLIPILDDGNFGVVTFLDPEVGKLVQIDVECAEETRATFRHWQQYLGDLMLRVGDIEDDEGRMRRIAELLGFAHTEALFAHFSSSQELDNEAWWEARRQFPLGLPG